MNSIKLTLVFASLALVLAFAVNCLCRQHAGYPDQFLWCGNGQSGSHGPHGHGHGYGR